MFEISSFLKQDRPIYNVPTTPVNMRYALVSVYKGVGMIFLFGGGGEIWAPIGTDFNHVYQLKWTGTLFVTCIEIVPSRRDQSKVFVSDVICPCLDSLIKNK